MLIAMRMLLGVLSGLAPFDNPTIPQLGGLVDVAS